MKKAIGFFLAGVILGELDPIGWGVWQVLERRLPRIREQSLAAPSPFEEIPASAWLAESEHAYAIEDTYAPTAPIHLLIVPKQRHATLLEPDTEILGETPTGFAPTRTCHSMRRACSRRWSTTRRSSLKAEF